MTGQLAKRLMRELEAREYLGSISHGAFFDLRKQGRIKTIYLGRAAYYAREDLDSFVSQLRSEQGLEAAAVSA